MVYGITAGTCGYSAGTECESYDLDEEAWSEESVSDMEDSDFDLDSISELDDGSLRVR